MRKPALLVFACLALAGCIDSSGPILTDSQQAFGPKLRVQLYTLRDGFEQEPQQAAFTWNGVLYEHADGAMGEVSGFSVHPFEGGLLPHRDARAAVRLCPRDRGAP